MIAINKNILNNYSATPTAISVLGHFIIIFAAILFSKNISHQKTFTEISLIHLPQIENFIEESTQQKSIQKIEPETKVKKQILPVKKSVIPSINKENKKPETATKTQSASQNNNNVKKTNSSSSFVSANNLGYLLNPAPQYPQSAKRRRIEGRVFLAIEILQNGDVSNVKIHKSSGFEILDKSALDAVKKWKFKKSSNKIKAIIPIEFKMQG